MNWGQLLNAVEYGGCLLAIVRLERIRNLGKLRLVCFFGGKGRRGVSIQMERRKPMMRGLV